MRRSNNPRRPRIPGMAVAAGPVNIAHTSTGLRGSNHCNWSGNLDSFSDATAPLDGKLTTTHRPASDRSPAPTAERRPCHQLLLPPTCSPASPGADRAPCASRSRPTWAPPSAWSSGSTSVTTSVRSRRRGPRAARGCHAGCRAAPHAEAAPGTPAPDAAKSSLDLISLVLHLPSTIDG